MEKAILKLLGRKDYTPMAADDLSMHLGFGRAHNREVQTAMLELEKRGLVARIKQNRWIIPREADLIPGRIRINRQGKGFVQPDDRTVPMIVVAESGTSTAFNEDRVLVRCDSTRKGPETELAGTVIRILERSRTQLVGTLQRSKSSFYVVPDDPRIPHDIYVPAARDVGKQPVLGDKVVVQLLEWTSRHTSPEGEIVEVLGAPDAEGVDMLSVLRNYNLPLRFPPNVLEDARSFPPTVTQEEMSTRVDCRSHQVVTIDPDDAKDFDDAICLEPADRGHWRLWVHIADVSHYVRPGTPLDEEARKRGNSTYLVDRVIPMLPESLSNELCSLKPQVDRLTKCVEFLLSPDGQVLKSDCYSAVIHSKQRFSYREVMAVLQRAPTNAIEKMLHQANDMAQKIRAHRMRNGSLNLDFPETKIRLDDDGRVLRVEKVENDVSHQLIEEYMLLANEAVATQLLSKKIAAVHRVHEPPLEARLQEFRQEVLSYRIPCGNLMHREEIQRLLNVLQELPIGPALKIGFLKSLMRARYAVEPLGHYGLNKEKYTHFTSPIRRYADLLVHRALFNGPTQRLSRSALEEAAEHISLTERNSSDAERDSKDVKLFAYLLDQQKSNNVHTYTALVTDVRNFGFFVDVTDLGMSGVVPLSSLMDDFYVFDRDRTQLVGRRFRRVVKLGDKVEVQVLSVDTFKRQVDFKLAPRIAEVKGAKTRGRGFEPAKKGAGTGVGAGVVPERARRERPARAEGVRGKWPKEREQTPAPAPARGRSGRPAKPSVQGQPAKFEPAQQRPAEKGQLRSSGQFRSSGPLQSGGQLRSGSQLRSGELLRAGSQQRSSQPPPLPPAAEEPILREGERPAPQKPMTEEQLRARQKERAGGQVRLRRQIRSGPAPKAAEGERRRSGPRPSGRRPAPKGKPKQRRSR